MNEIPELTAEQFARALPASVRKRLMLGQFDSGEDIAALRRFVGLTQSQFALAMSISVHALRNWEQGPRHPEGPAIALLRIAARHPRIIRENIERIESAAGLGLSAIQRSQPIRAGPSKASFQSALRAYTSP